MESGTTMGDGGLTGSGGRVWSTDIVTGRVPAHRSRDTLRERSSRRAAPMLLQRTETLRRLSLVPHMSQKLLKGKPVADEAFKGQGLDGLLVVQDVDTTSFGVQMPTNCATRLLKS